MNEAKHTAGPWFTHRNGFSSVYIEARVGGGMLQEVACCGPTNEGSDQQEANARLIAAAPELLESCKSLLTLTQLMANESYYDEAIVEFEIFSEKTKSTRCLVLVYELAKARAAIAKATGAGLATLTT